jgi:glycosyltransferase involved in cell wall biosynthesis
VTDERSETEMDRQGGAEGPAAPLVTVVTPVYNEDQGLETYRREVEAVLFSRQDIHFDVLLVDDGSRDASWREIRRICAENPRFRALRLSRNFGSHIALSAGIHHCNADAVCTLAADLQDPPEALLAFVEKWRAGAQIVWGRRARRDEPNWRVRGSNLFAHLVGRYALPQGSRFTTGSFLLIDRRVVEAFQRFREHNRIVFAIVAWTGFEQEVVEYNRRARTFGASSWTLGRILKALYDAFIAFSRLPAQVMTLIGVAVFLLTFVIAAILIVLRIFDESIIPGWTSIIVLLCLLFGTNFLMLGVVVEYLSRIYLESTARPLYFVSQTIGLEPHDS